MRAFPDALPIPLLGEAAHAYTSAQETVIQFAKPTNATGWKKMSEAGVLVEETIQKLRQLKGYHLALALDFIEYLSQRTEMLEDADLYEDMERVEADLEAVRRAREGDLSDFIPLEEVRRRLGED